MLAPQQEGSMFTRLGKFLVFICGLLLFLFGFYLLLLHFGVFPIIGQIWMNAMESVKGYLNSREFADWVTVGIAILAVIGGMILMLWGIRKTK